jgi:hypothetical protein
MSVPNTSPNVVPPTPNSADAIIAFTQWFFEVYLGYAVTQMEAETGIKLSLPEFKQAENGSKGWAVKLPFSTSRETAYVTLVAQVWSYVGFLIPMPRGDWIAKDGKKIYATRIIYDPKTKSGYIGWWVNPPKPYAKRA